MQESGASRDRWTVPEEILTQLQDHLYTGLPINRENIRDVGERFSLPETKIGPIEATAFALLEDSLRQKQQDLPAACRTCSSSSSRFVTKAGMPPVAERLRKRAGDSPPSFSNGLSPTPVGCHGTVGSRTEPAEENSFSCGLKLILIRQPAVSRMAPESILTIGTLEMIDPHFPPCLLLPAAASES